MVKWPNCHGFFYQQDWHGECPAGTGGPDYPSTRRWSESPSRAATAQGRRRYASCALPLPQPTSAEGWCLSIYLSFCLSTYLSICLFTLLSICLFVALSFCLFVVLFFCLSSIHPPICLSLPLCEVVIQQSFSVLALLHAYMIHICMHMPVCHMLYR